MHGAAQKASEPGETVAQNSFTETNRFPFPTWTVRQSLFFCLDYFFLFLTTFLLSFFSPFFLFFELPHQGTGMGRLRGGAATDVRTRWRMDEQWR
jgi:hypothetical protein